MMLLKKLGNIDCIDFDPAIKSVAKKEILREFSLKGLIENPVQ